MENSFPQNLNCQRESPWLKYPLLLLLAAAVAAYIWIMGAYVLAEHAAYRTQAFDLGIMDQAVWLAGQGEDVFITVRGLHRFGDHVEYLVYLLAPIYWIWDDVRALLLLQTVVIGVGAVPIYLLAQARIGSIVGLGLAAAYLLNPAVQNLNLDHVHAEAFGAVAMLFAIHAADRRRFTWMFFFSTLALLCKEDVALFTGVFGLVVALKWNRRAGIALTALSAVWFILCMKVLIPYYNTSGFFRFSGGGWFTGWASNRFNFSWYIATIFNKEVLKYLLHLLAPLAFLPLLAPVVAFPGFCAAFIMILSGTQYLRSIEYHYTTSIIPYFFMASVYAIERLVSVRWRIAQPVVRAKRIGNVVRISSGLRLFGPEFPQPVACFIMAAVVGATSLIGNNELSKLPVKNMKRLFEERREYAASATAETARRAIAQIPPGAVVSADYLLLPHLAHRVGIYMFPNPFENDQWGVQGENQHDPAKVEYVLVSAATLQGPARIELVKSLVRKGEFEPKINEHYITLLKRKAPPGTKAD